MDKCEVILAEKIGKLLPKWKADSDVFWQRDLGIYVHEPQKVSVQV